eukprot:TRINITY_DN37332_c0_g1_i1.p1 TRINITY_DN37332_c0_g1~~TRINITY_DN37332_c0_g1_i1.p1  ORF type:complete len:613 (+),score=117.07 TRINITY_DN37332_c0_g1_i1:99-1937(+)
MVALKNVFFFFFQAEDGIRDAQESRGLGDVYKRQSLPNVPSLQRLALCSLASRARQLQPASLSGLPEHLAHELVAIIARSNPQLQLEHLLPLAGAPLRRLELASAVAVDGRWADAFKWCPLEQLDLSSCLSCNWDDEAMAKLTEFAEKGTVIPCISTSMNSLILPQSPNLTNMSMPCLALLPNLVVLSIPGSAVSSSGLLQVAEVLPCLQSLNISQCHKVKQLDFLSRLHRLRVLNGSKVGGWGSKCVAHIAAIKSLRVLRLQECSRLSNASLEGFGGLPLLEVLDLKGCHRITDHGVRHLTRTNSTITSLDLSDSLITDQGLHQLCMLPYLVSLQVARCPGLSHDGVHRLAHQLPNTIINLQLKGISQLGAHGMKLEVSPSLRALDVSNCQDLPGLAPTNKLLFMRTLVASGVALDGLSVETVSSLCPNLTALDLSANRHALSTSALICLGKLDQLTSLRLTGCGFELDPPFDLLEQCWTELKGLRLLCVSYAQGLDPEAVSKLLGPIGSQLQSLAIGGSELCTGTGLLDASWPLPNLLELDLSDNLMLADDGMAAIAQASPNLTGLNISGCVELTPGCLEPWSHHQLRTLSIRDCPGLDDTVCPLSLIHI